MVSSRHPTFASQHWGLVADDLPHLTADLVPTTDWAFSLKRFTGTLKANAPPGLFMGILGELSDQRKGIYADLFGVRAASPEQSGQ